MLEEPMRLIELISKSTLHDHFQCSFTPKESLVAFNEIKKQVCALKEVFVLLHNDYLCRYKKESCSALAILVFNTSQNVFSKLIVALN